MKIAQVNLVVPDEIYTDIMKGTLEIAAGVVRDNKGVIRKHLPIMASVAKDNNALKAVAANKNAMQIVKKLKVVGIIIGAAAAVGAGVFYMVHRHKEKKAEALEKCIGNFQNALKAYLKATKAGAINKNDCRKPFRGTGRSPKQHGRACSDAFYSSNAAKRTYK